MRLPGTRAFSHQPSPGWQRFGSTVLRAGRMVSPPGRTVERRRHLGHDWLLVLAGSGIVTCAGVSAVARAGDLVWIDNRRPHRHVADRRDPWDLLWLRCDGCALRQIHRALGLDRDPVARDAAATARLFDRIIACLEKDPVPGPALDARLAAAVAGIIAEIASLHQAHTLDDPAVSRVVAAIAADPVRTWTISAFSRIAGLPPSTFHRRFARATGGTPMEHLRRVRIAQAQELLLADDRPIAVIGREVGFADPFHFSRAFRRCTGLAPRTFRAGG